MTNIDLLFERVSRPILEAPGPTDEQLDLMFRAALRAPDHARLRPWRFLTVTGEGRAALGELMAAVALEDKPDLSPEAINRFKGLPLRAPTLILAICHTREHPKVPVIEQQLSLAAAVQNILLSAHGQGFGAICYHPLMETGLELADNEQLLGFIYLGMPTGSVKKLHHPDVNDFVTQWPSESGAPGELS